MKNSTKWVLISVGAVAVGTGGFFLFKAIRDKFFKTQLDDPNAQKKVTTSDGQTLSTTPPALADTPFTSNEEGNAFRGWVNDNYPDYAKQIDLDRTGSYNNSYIKKAWAKYGSAYTSNKSNPPKPTASDFVLLNSLVGAFTKTLSTSSKLQIATSQDRPQILIDFYPEGLMVVQKNKDWYTPIYAKVSGSWRIQNSNAILTLDGKEYTLTPTNNNGIWSMLKGNGYLSAQDGSFIPFIGNDEPQKNGLRRDDMELNENSVENLM
jgi:hypothetical protein